jgi:ribosomal protein L37AE/L43A
MFNIRYKWIYLDFTSLNTSWFILYNGVKTSEIKMSKKNQLEKLCPECEEEMNPVYDKNKILTCWECTECGTIVSATKEAKQEKL